MVLNDSTTNIDDGFYSPMCLTPGYLTPLQRKKLREKRNTPLKSDFETDFKTPKSSSKSVKKPKRPIAAKSKAKAKTPKAEPKSSKENQSEVRYSVASLVAQNPSDGTIKERRFFKNRSPQHLQKTEFVMRQPCYKKRSLDFSGEKKILLPRQPIENTKQTPAMDATDFKSKENKPVMCETNPIVSVNTNNSITGTPKRKVLPRKEQSVSPCANISVRKEQSVASNESTPVRERKLESSANQPMEIDFTHTNPIDVTPKRKVVARKEQSLEVNNEVVEFCSDTIEVRVGGDFFNFDLPSDEELLKRQNEARAKLKKALSVRDNHSTVAENPSTSRVAVNKVDIQKKSSSKLFPIFNNLQKAKTDPKSSTPKRPTNGMRDTSKGEEQMIIDAGQKEIGSRVCKTCNMLYTIGHEEDERLHTGYHDTFLVNLRFSGWKNERIVGDFDDGRVIKVLDTDKNFQLKKVEDVLFIANRDLGFPTAGFPTRPNIIFYLFISNDKKVGGCLVAEPIESACPVVLGEEKTTVQKAGETPIWKLGNWYASTKPVKAICGINRIWVAAEFRRQKVASRLIDCLRGSFIYGHVVDCREMAFTDPSPDGRLLAAAYTGTDNFLVYK